MDNYLRPIINKMRWRIEQPDVETAKLADIIKTAFQFRESILDDDRVTKNDRKNVMDFTEVIVRANHRAQQILNGVEYDVEAEVAEALAEIEKEMNKKNGYTGKD